MRALYCKHEGSFLDFLAPVFQDLDSLYWIVDCQMGPVNYEWLFQSPDREQAFDDILVPVPEFQRSGAVLWRPGALSLLRDGLYFDEWSYLTGFKSVPSEAPQKAAQLERLIAFTENGYRTIEKETELHLVHVDGWWELYPSSPLWFERIQQACGKCREMSPRPAGDSNWRPSFI
jgi:hypothetical protein